MILSPRHVAAATLDLHTLVQPCNKAAVDCTLWAPPLLHPVGPLDGPQQKAVPRVAQLLYDPFQLERHLSPPERGRDILPLKKPGCMRLVVACCCLHSASVRAR